MIFKNAAGKGATVPFHSAKTLHPKVLKSILRDGLERRRSPKTTVALQSSAAFPD
jgi:hypothetical protein